MLDYLLKDREEDLIVRVVLLTHDKNGIDRTFNEDVLRKKGTTSKFLRHMRKGGLVILTLTGHNEGKRSTVKQ